MENLRNGSLDGFPHAGRCPTGYASNAVPVLPDGPGDPTFSGARRGAHRPRSPARRPRPHGGARAVRLGTPARARLRARGQVGQAAQARHDRQAPGADARRPVVVQLGEAPAHRGRQRPGDGTASTPSAHGARSTKTSTAARPATSGSPAATSRCGSCPSGRGSGVAATPPSASTAPTTSRTSAATPASRPTSATSRTERSRRPWAAATTSTCTRFATARRSNRTTSPASSASTRRG